MTETCLILPHETGDGPTNMALDEVLLDRVAEDPSLAVIRTYQWTVPTLSLGYFQAIADAELDPRWEGVPIVRRPTGGGALWHDHEITYAVVVPGDHPAARPSRKLYRAIHEAIADHLRSLGVPAGRRGDDVGSLSLADRPFLCFGDRDSEDIVAGGFKLVGSAQRRRAGAVLQHGSILLGRSSRTPELPGLADLAPVASDPQTWADRLRSILPRAIGLAERPGVVSPEIESNALQLMAEVYANSSWTRRR
jgi:lipoate-protein ligase A